eukprot:1141219-Pyramimonas_sp.AAC.1
MHGYGTNQSRMNAGQLGARASLPCPVRPVVALSRSTACIALPSRPGRLHPLRPAFARWPEGDDEGVEDRDEEDNSGGRGMGEE